MKGRSLSLSLVAALAVAGSLPATAENACKGLSQSACDGSQHCTWVQPYTRKDGRQVGAYCRAKPAPKSSAAVPPKATPAS